MKHHLKVAYSYVSAMYYYEAEERSFVLSDKVTSNYEIISGCIEVLYELYVDPGPHDIC